MLKEIKGELRSGDYKEAFELLCKTFNEDVNSQKKKTMIENKVVYTVDGLISFCKGRSDCNITIDVPANSFSIIYSEPVKHEEVAPKVVSDLKEEEEDIFGEE